MSRKRREKPIAAHSMQSFKHFSPTFAGLALALSAVATPVNAQVQGDPQGSSPLLGALQWVQGTLLGNLATTAAVIAVAAVGFLMLTGRIDWKRGLTVVMGAFIIFGAAAIVAGIRSMAGGLN
jgi:type IV secretory pathway VirB2 component (pilin)